MTYTTLLVQLDIDSELAPTLTFALGMAREFEADLIAFAAAEAHVYVPGPEGGVVAAELMMRQTEEIERRLNAMKEEFFSVAGDMGRASWRGFVGEPTRQLALHARAADLVLVGPRPHKGKNHHRTIELGTFVLSSGRPVLIAADDLTPVRVDKAVVAWKDTREARRAVSDAMPFLIKAKEVVVVTIEEENQKDARDSAADVVRFLMRHGAAARADVLGAPDGDAEGAIANIAHGIGADLLVAGAYGHSRLREWAFGGVTHSLLADGSLHRVVSN